MNSLETPPGWAFSWCWYFFIASAISAITAVLTLVTLVTMFSELNKKGSVPLLAAYIVVLGVQSVTAMVTFWMCRSSLKPSN